MKRTLPAALLLAVAAACDSPSGSGPRVEQVTISPDMQTVSVGATTRLSATARDGDNAVMSNVTFQWTSLDGGVASVSGTGRVTAVAAGTARIVAAAPNGVADTAQVTVQGVSADCTEPGAAARLAVGESFTVSGAAAATLCLDGGADGAEYAVMPFHGTTARAGVLSARLTGIGVTGAATAVSPSLSLAASPRTPVGDGGFHTRLNERAVPYLTALVPGARARMQARREAGARMSLQQTTPAVGTRLELNVSQEFCESPDIRIGRIVAVGQRAIVVADTANPAGGFTQADYDHVAATFDTLVYPVQVAAFGAPEDVDQNGRVVIFYTRAVNELTPANVNYVVGGFFYGRDLFPRQPDDRFPACGGSNYSEMFYMLAPDPAGEVNGNVRSTASVRGGTIGVVAHEFQHLISASRRLYVVPGVGGTAWSEETFLNEGLSHIAEELLFYHRSGTEPRRNLGGEIVENQGVFFAFDAFQEANFDRYGEYLRDPGQQSPYDADDNDLATRGAAWAFLRWAADRRAGDDLQLWYDLVNSDAVGLVNLQRELGEDPIPLFRDFAMSVYADDLVPGIPAAFRQPSWDHRSLYTRLNRPYPLPTQPLAGGAPVNVSLVAGGSAYLRTRVAAGGLGSVSVSSGGAAPPSSLSVTVLRIQ